MLEQSRAHDVNNTPQQCWARLPGAFENHGCGVPQVIVSRLTLLPNLQNNGMRTCTSSGATQLIGSTLRTAALCLAHLLNEHQALHRLVPTSMHGTHTKYERLKTLKHTLDFHHWAISLKEKHLCIFCVQPLIVKPSLHFRVHGEKSDYSVASLRLIAAAMLLIFLLSIILGVTDLCAVAYPSWSTPGTII